MDKLVEKINSQGAMRSQGIYGTQETASRNASHQISASEEKIINAVVEKLTKEMNDENARTVEMITGFHQENSENATKVREELADHMHKESVKCYRNTQAAVEESLSKQNETTTQTIKKTATQTTILLSSVIVLLAGNLGVAIVILLRLFGMI